MTRKSACTGAEIGETAWITSSWRTCGIDCGLPRFHTEWSIALNPAQENRLCADPLQFRMATLPESWIVRIFFPQPLPMHKDIDVVPFDHDAFNRKVQHDGSKRLEISLGFFLQRSSWSSAS